MNRKLLAIIMALAILIAIIPAALAAEPTTSTGEIEFTADSSKDGAYDPEEVGEADLDDILDPDDEDVKAFLASLSSMDLYFGEQDIDLVNNQSYPSFEPAGVLVLSHADSWELTVAITEFKIGTAATIKGFDMDLKADGGSTLGGVSAIDTMSIQGLAAGVDGDFGAAKKIATGSQGVSGANYDAELNVLANTASEGEAKAQLKWTYAVTP